MFMKIVSCLPSHCIVMVKSTASALTGVVPLNSRLFRFYLCVTGVSGSECGDPDAASILYDVVEDMLRTSHEHLSYPHLLRRDH